MKSKQIVILALILAALIAGIVIKKYQPRPELATEEYVPIDLSFDSEKVSKLTIRKEKKDDPNSAPQVELIKSEDGTWILPSSWNAHADKAKIEKFFQEIKKVKGELRGKSKEVFQDFGISESQGVQVLLADASGQALLEFVLGTQKADYGTIFIRKKDSESVYLTAANLYGNMGVFGDPGTDEPRVDYWTLKNIASFDIEKVKKIESVEFENGKESAWVLEKEGTRWKLSGQEIPFPPGEEKVRQYLSIIRNNSADKILDPKAKDYGFSNPRWKVKLTLESGDEVDLAVGNADTPEQKDFYLQASGAPVVFLISKFYFENMKVDGVWFLGHNPLEVDSAQIEKFVVHADKTEMVFYPSAKKWDALTSYLDSLKNFKIEKAAAQKARFGKYWIELQKKGEKTSTLLDISETTVGDNKNHLLQKRGTTAVFEISDTLFHQLFDNLDRLKEPAAA